MIIWNDVLIDRYALFSGKTVLTSGREIWFDDVGVMPTTKEKTLIRSLNDTQSRDRMLAYQLDTSPDSSHHMDSNKQMSKG
jgi:hypothetical protein